MPRKPDLSEADRAAVSQSVKHARLIEASRKLARIVKHTDPPPQVKAARSRLEKSLTKWMQHHGGEAFDRPFSEDHKRCIAKIEAAGNDGGMFALAMPRGHGKSTILKWATLYFMLTGRRRFVVVVAATAELAQAIVDFTRQQIQESDSLHAHYPHVTTYARATDGKAIKAKYQLRADGKTSGILWSKTTLVFPEVLDGKGQPYPSNGGILEGHGLTGAIRGKWRDTKSGKTLRPDFVLLDDPQTRESAESDAQCNMRERIITGDVLGLAGPRKRIAACMPCTIVRKGDLADRFLSHDTHPEWQGETCSLVRSWPDAQDTLWQEYSRIFRDDGLAAATIYYRNKRAEMDEGSAVSWKHRVRDGELSAIQTAENLLIESGDQFWSEYQNVPKDPIAELAPYTLTPEIILSRMTKRPAWEREQWVTRVFASSDINPSYAASTVVQGFGEDQSDALLWYGLYPLDIPVRDMPAAEYARALYPELVKHGKAIAASPCRPEAWALDAGGDQFDAIAPYVDRLSQATGLTVIAFTGRRGIKYGAYGQTVVKSQIRQHCHGCATIKGGQRLRWIAWDADFWGEVAQKAWLGEPGAPGQASLYYGRHWEFARQICNKRLVKIEDKGGKIEHTWQNVPGKQDFHDAMAQGYALAAYYGIGTGGQEEKRASSGPARVLVSRPSQRR